MEKNPASRCSCGKPAKRASGMLDGKGKPVAICDSCWQKLMPSGLKINGGS